MIFLMRPWSKAIVLCLVIAIVFSKYSNAEIAPVDPEVGKKQHDENAPTLEIHNEPTKTKSDSIGGGYMGTSGSFVHGFIATLSVIVVSELGDKTFFIAAIMAMRHPRWTVFIGELYELWDFVR